MEVLFVMRKGRRRQKMGPLCFEIALLALSLAAAQCARAAEPANSAVRIALLADTHLACETQEGRIHRRRFERAVSEVNAANVAFVLIAGDLTEDGTQEEFEEFQEVVRRFRAPVFCVPGNHDIGGKRATGFSAGPTMERVKAYEQAIGPCYFSRESSGVRIIGISGSLMGSGLPAEKPMWKMLEAELSGPAKAPTVLLTHYPPFLDTPDEQGSDYWKLFYWDIEPVSRRRLLALLKKGAVTTVLSGHLHHPQIKRYDGVLFVTTPAISFGLPRGKQPEGWTLVTLPSRGEAGVEFKTIGN